MVQSNKEMQKHKDFSQKKAKWGEKKYPSLNLCKCYVFVYVSVKS